MDESQAFNSLKKLMNDAQTLANGQEFLENCLNSLENFGADACKILVSNDLENDIKKFIAVVIKNFVCDIWNDNSILQNQKKEIREIILNGVVMNTGNLEMIEELALIIVELINKDGIDIWINPLQQFVEWMQTEDINIIDTGLELFLHIFKKIDDQRLKSLVPQMMPTLFQIFTYQDTISYEDGFQSKLVGQCFDETYDLWISLFISALQSSPKSHINIKRYILKILTVLYRDFPYYSRKSLGQTLTPIWTFFNKILPLYIWNVVYNVDLQDIDDSLKPVKNDQSAQKKTTKNYIQTLDFRFLEHDDEYDNDIEGLAVSAIELITSLVVKEQLYMLFKFAVFPIVNALAHLMLLTREQEIRWVQDPNQYIVEEEDEESFKTLRVMALRLISELIEKWGDQAIQAVMMISEKFLMNYEEQHTVNLIQDIFNKVNDNDLKGSYMMDFNKDKLMGYVKGSNFECEHPDHVWKKREVALLLLGSFANDIIFFSEKHQNSFELQKLIDNLIQDLEIEGQIPILVAKSLWTISKFSEIIALKHRDLFLVLFKVATRSLQKRYEFPVRITAVKAIGQFAHKIDLYREQLFTPDNISAYGVENISILNDIFEILRYSKDDALYTLLDTLINLNALSDIYAPYIAEIGSKQLLQIFTIYHDNQQKEKIIVELITKLSHNKEAFPKLFNDFSPFILECFQVFNTQLKNCSDLQTLKSTDINLMTSIFAVTSNFVKNAQDFKTSECLITLLEPLLNVMQICEDTSLQQHASICLKNFIKVAFPHILKKNLVPFIFKVLNKLLEVSANSALEGCSIYSGNLVMISFNNLTNGQIDLELMKKLTYKVFRSRMPSTVQGLVLVYARMINNNPTETVNFLTSFSIENRMAIKILIDKWLLQQPAFRGRATKNATLSALIKLFKLKDKRIENLLVLAYNPSHTNVGNDVHAPLKIFSTLIRALDNEMAYTRKDKDLLKKDGGSTEDEIGRQDSMEDDGSYEMKDEEDSNNNQIQVNLEKFDDDEDIDLVRRFATQERKGGGLGDFENGSTNFMTEGLGFIYEDEGEADEATEEDLQYLKDPCYEYNTAELLKEFFIKTTQNDSAYFNECSQLLLKEDVALLQKYIKINKNA